MKNFGCWATQIHWRSVKIKTPSGLVVV